MRSIGSLFCALFLLLIASVASATVVTDTISVTSMQCVMCERRIESELKKNKFISFVEADSELLNVVVQYDDEKAKRRDIEVLISKIGYDTELVKADPVAQGNLKGCCKPGAHKKAE